MANLRIVPATVEDVPAILELIRALAEYEKLSHIVAATMWDAECAGFALFFPNYSTFLAQPGIYLEDLYVKPHLRGKGIGADLLAALARLAMERNCGRVEWSVLDWNAPSIEFYKKLGAVAMDDWTTFRLSGPALARLAG
jgi:GNAT superfamily N-acetyltransferase